MLLKFQKQVKDKMPKKSLFHARDFQTLMYPCFIFCRILGIFPYKINNSIFETSKPHYILSITITCVICVYELIFLYKFNASTKINFKAVITFIEVNSYRLIISCLAIVTLVLSNPRMRLLQTIMKISLGLSPESYQKLSRLIHVKDIFGFFFLIGRSSLYFYKSHQNILYKIISIYTVLLSFQTDMLYVNCVCVLKACFEEINNSLLHMQQLIINNESCVFNIFCYKQRNPFVIIKLKALEKQHMMISNTVQMLNMIFSLQLLATTFITFFELCLKLYFHLVHWHNGLVIKLDEQMNGMFLSFMIYLIIKMVLIVWACETGKNQAQEIRTTIHDVLNSTRDEQIKNEVIKVQFNTLLFL